MLKKESFKLDFKNSFESVPSQAIYDIVSSKKVDKQFYISKYEQKVLKAWNEFYLGIDLKVIGFPVWADEFNNTSVSNNSGYLNPLTLESHVNKNIPAFNYITTAAHEMAHQLGIAAENEANFIAFYTSINNPDPFIKFSGYSFGLKYCYADLYKLNQKKAKDYVIATGKQYSVKTSWELSEC